MWQFDRHVVSRTLGMSFRAGRASLEVLAALDPPPRGVRVRKGKVAGKRARLFVPDGAAETPRLLWIHGGAFCFNSPLVYSTFLAHVAEALGSSAVMPAYRLAPEHPFPAARDDALAAYSAVSAAEGPLILGGDSAGGNLALGTAIALRDAGEPPPAGLLLMSPWADLTLSGDSIRANDGKDAILRAEYLPRTVRAYANGMDPADPRLSPLNADLAGLPPTLIQCGTDDLFRSESEDLGARMEAAGTLVEFHSCQGMWHDFQTHAGMLPEAARAVGQMGEWSRSLLAGD